MEHHHHNHNMDNHHQAPMHHPTPIPDSHHHNHQEHQHDQHSPTAMDTAADYEDAVAEPEHMGHAGHGGGGGGHSMTFHGGFTEVILFSFWRIDSTGGLIGSMAACVVLGVLFEGIKSLRDFLNAKEWEKKVEEGGDEEEEEEMPERDSGGGGRRRHRREQQQQRGWHSDTENDGRRSNGSKKTSSPLDKKKRDKRRLSSFKRSARLLLRSAGGGSMWSRSHLLQTLLHLLQVTLSYTLMLVFMTFNSWLCAATVCGMALGYFLFGWRRRAAVLEQAAGGRPQDEGECCA